MKLSLLVILILFLSCASVKNNIKEKQKTEFTGVITKEGLVKEPNKAWFEHRYTAFKLNDSIKNKMQKQINENIKVKAFVGLWCSDSKREIPTFLKILNEVNFSEKNIEIIAVDHKKKANGLEKGFGVFRVPTFILYKKDKELGRFVEFPVESL